MAALLRCRKPILRRLLAPLLTASAILLAAAEVCSTAFVDGVVAEVATTVITAGDVGLARALHLFGFQPSDAPIHAGDVERLVDGQLADGEALQLEILPSGDEVEGAWNAVATRLGGGEALRAWLEENGIGESWARRMVEADLRRRNFIALRFRAYVFVSEAEVNAAVGPGTHTPEEREAVRDSLIAAATREGLAAWIQEARGRVRIRLIELPPAGFPAPFPMPRASRTGGDPATSENPG